MIEKLVIPCLYLYQGKAVQGKGQESLLYHGDAEGLSRFYGDRGADELLVWDCSAADEEHEAAVRKIKAICRTAQVPVAAAGNIKRPEDVKKFLYAGCHRVLLDLSQDSNVGMLKEVSERFGKNKIAVLVSAKEEFLAHQESVERYAQMAFIPEGLSETMAEFSSIPIVACMEGNSAEKALGLLKEVQVQGISGAYVSRLDVDLAEFKKVCKENGIAVNTFESRIGWSEFQLGRDGLIPVVVQDDQTDEVLMLAYMNEEAFQATLRTGRMTYWSRSRQELWVKGMTSGHFQYVKSLALDCDNDTILARVAQVGAACHTGNHSCFFQELAHKASESSNPLKIFQQVYDVILDRKEHPKEGSYTNYLFEKGIDKILKKLGEECTEIIIAAKNPDKEEVKYEMSDFLYHMMVLMAEKGVSWEEITQELAHR